MSRTQIVFLAIVLLLAAFIGALALRNRQPPVLPADRSHAVLSELEACRACHGSDGPAPRPDTHPVGNDCLRCHGVP